jgi:hypothetical protein
MLGFFLLLQQDEPTVVWFATVIHANTIINQQWSPHTAILANANKILVFFLLLQKEQPTAAWFATVIHTNTIINQQWSQKNKNTLPYSHTCIC